MNLMTHEDLVNNIEELKNQIETLKGQLPVFQYMLVLCITSLPPEKLNQVVADLLKYSDHPINPENTYFDLGFRTQANVLLKLVQNAL